MDSETSIVSLGVQSLRISWLFQGVVAFPCGLVLGWDVFSQLFGPYITPYRFITYTFNGLFAAGILFIVILQFKINKRDERHPSAAIRQLNLILEIAKSVLATAMWIWLLLDSIFYCPPYYGYYPKDNRIISSAVSVVLLFVFFYPTALFTAYIARKTEDEGDTFGPNIATERRQTTDAAADEDTPLLSDRRDV